LFAFFNDSFQIYSQLDAAASAIAGPIVSGSDSPRSHEEAIALNRVFIMNEVRFRPRFGLKSLFISTTALCWFMWQFTLAQQRAKIAAEQVDQHCYTFYNDTISPLRLNQEFFPFAGEPPKGDPMWRGALSAITGWDNTCGVTVVISSILLISQSKNHSHTVSTLQRLHGLTRVVVIVFRPDAEHHPEVMEFEERLRRAIPNADIQYHHIRVPVS
jgi:hypothetical protein